MKEEADLIIKNGKIYTVNKEKSWEEAVAVKNGKIIYVGKNDGVEEFIGSKTKVIDVGMKMVMPGFIDTHAHVSVALPLFLGVNLFGSKSVEEIQDRIKKYREKHPDTKVIRGVGFANELFGVKGPRKKYLDDVVSDVPVVLSSYDLHSVWGNSKAFDIVNITKDTPDPEGGIIVHDENGELTGVLKEFATTLLRESGKLAPGKKEILETILAYQEECLSNGVTSSADALLTPGSFELEAFKELDKASKLKVKFHGNLAVDDSSHISVEKQIQNIIKEIEENRKNCSYKFQTNTVKLFADGVTDQGTAYYTEPYIHRDDNYFGFTHWTNKQMTNLVDTFDKQGIQIHVHSIGDNATQMMIDAIKNAENKNSKRDRRHILAHLEYVRNDQIKQLKELDIVAALTTQLMGQKEYYDKILLPYIGKERADQYMPFKKIVDGGILVCGATDYPVTQNNPFMSIFVGMARRNVGDPDTDEYVIGREESGSLEELIQAFTINGAYAYFMENKTGSIEVGKMADMVVIDQNLFEIPVDDIPKTKVLLTLVEGEEVYKSPQFNY